MWEPNDKRKINFICRRRWSSEKKSSKDDIREFLDNQDAPASEKIEMPEDLVSK